MAKKKEDKKKSKDVVEKKPVQVKKKKNSKKKSKKNVVAKVKTSKKKATKIVAKKTNKKKTKKVKVTTKAVSVIDWKSLKVLYFEDSQISIEAFLRDMGVLAEGKRPTVTMGKKYKGWRDEKLKHLSEKQEQKALALQAKYDIEAKFAYSTTLQKKMRLLNIIDDRISKSHLRTSFGNFVISTKDLIQMINVVKTELGEPTSISKSNVSTANLDINELIDQLSNDNKTKNLDDKDNDAGVYGEQLFKELPVIKIDGREV